MNSRERILAGAVMALVALWAGRSMFMKYRTAVDARRAAVQDAQTKLADANLTLAKGRSAVQQMEALQKRSLPSDRERSLSLYKAWLLTKAKAAGLTVNDIKLAPRTTASAAFDAIGYQLEANGTLSSIISLLYEFYHSPQLQQITRLRLQRPPGATQLQVTLEVEALCLPGAIATDVLPAGESKRLKLANAAEYQKSIGERDLATVYTPPRPPAPPAEKREGPPAPPKFDEAQLAKFTGSVEGQKGREAWIRVFTTGEMLHLNAGDPVKIGTVEGQIESIDRLSLVLKIGEKKYLVALGQSLLGGKELDAEGKVKPEAAPEQPKSST